MIVTCSKCSTKFKIADEKITDSGVKVRCSKCKHTFAVTSSGVKEIDQPSSIPPSSASTSTLPPPPRELPLPPPPKLVDKVQPPKPPENKAAVESSMQAEAVPDDIFASPTKVGPAPESFNDKSKPLPPPPPPAAKKASAFEKMPQQDSFPSLDESPTEKIPAPPQEAFGVVEPAKAIPADLVNSIDLDSDSLLPGTGPDVKDSSNRPVLSEDLFSDLDSAIEQLAPAGEVQGQSLAESAADKDASSSTDMPTPTPAISSADDPFAGIDINVPAAPSTGYSLQSPEPEPEVPSPPPPENSSPSMSMDDPFSDIDLSSGEGQVSASNEEEIFSDPFASLPPAQDAQQEEAKTQQPTAQVDTAADSDGDLFSNLGDPFAGLDGSGPVAPPPLPGNTDEQKADLASTDDLFSALPSSEVGGEGRQSAPPGGLDPSVGHDPFAGLDSGEFSGEQAQLEMGMALDADGKVEGQDLPSGPPPTKTLSGSEQDKPASEIMQRPPAPPPMLTKPTDTLAPEAKGAFLFKALFALVLIVILFFAFVAFRHGGKPDLAKWSTYVEAFTGHNSSSFVKGDLQVLDVASTAYKNRVGQRLVVLWGNIRNNGTTSKKGVVVAGELLRKDKPVSSLSVPAGIVFTPEEVFSMLDAVEVKEAYARKYKPEKSSIEPGKRIPFMVVLLDHPSHLDGLKVRAVPDQKDDPLSAIAVDDVSHDTAKQSDAKKTPSAPQNDQKLPAADTTAASGAVKKTAR